MSTPAPAAALTLPAAVWRGSCEHRYDVCTTLPTRDKKAESGFKTDSPRSAADRYDSLLLRLPVAYCLKPLIAGVEIMLALVEKVPVLNF